MSGRVPVAAMILSSVLGASACAGVQQQSQVPVATTSDELLTYTIPSVRPVELGTETQEQKRAIVSVIPKAFTVSDTPKKDCVHGPEQPKGMLDNFVKVSNGQPEKKPYVITSQTGLDYEPKLLSFVLKITNHSDKIMRLGELYLKVIINSQEVEVSKFDVDAIKAGVLLKGDSKEFTVSVPEWNRKSDDATIDFSLQNVPIEIEKNGQVAEVGDFSWTFIAKTETKQTKSKKTTENLMLDPAEAASLHCHHGTLAAN